MSKHSAASDFALLDGTARTQDGSGSVRGALRAWLARLVADVDLSAEAAGGVTAAPAVATPFENRVRRLRANARAAYMSVEGARRIEGADVSALDAALEVIEAEWRSVLAERDRCAEALKAIRIYAPDARCRSMAADGLADARSRSGVDRFPFVGEFDA